MSGYVENNLCIVKHTALEKRIDHVEKDGENMSKKYDKAVYLLIANLVAVITLLLKSFF